MGVMQIIRNHSFLHIQRDIILRTPQDNGLDDLWYGDGIYSVSLTDGNIKPVNVGDTSMGIRPVMAIPQG